MINIYSSARYTINKKIIKTYTQELLDRLQTNRGAVLNIALIGKRKMKAIAKEYKNEDVALPVLSFSYQDEPIRADSLIGEIVICYPQAVLLAAERSKKVEDMFKQLIEHGMQNIFLK
jgi:rRNA maturation RNase YbeY